MEARRFVNEMYPLHHLKLGVARTSFYVAFDWPCIVEELSVNFLDWLLYDGKRRFLSTVSAPQVPWGKLVHDGNLTNEDEAKALLQDS